MFTSLFQLEKKPVTLFSSTDKGAPILTGDAGSLKTLLKACLVTGYGDKQGLGWQMLYETDDKNSACFVSSEPTASKYVLKVDNASANVKLSAYQAMSSFTQGEKPLVENQVYQTKKCEWRLIGHGRAFVLVVDFALNNSPNKFSVAMPLLFGDLPRQNKRITPVCVIWCGRQNDYGLSGVQTTLFHHVNGNPRSGGYDLYYASAYPFIVNNGQDGANLTKNYCRFNHDSQSSATALHEPVLCNLPDGTWTFLPMLQPLSSNLLDVANLGLVNENMMKVATGYSTNNQNIINTNDCIIPLDWWWA